MNSPKRALPLWAAAGLIFLGLAVRLHAGPWIGLASAPTVDQQLSTAEDLRLVDLVGGHMGGVAVQGQYLYQVIGSRLAVLDLADPSHPVQVGFVRLPTWARGLVVRGDYAYLTGDKVFWVVDISDPFHPLVVGSAELEAEVLSLTLALAGDYVFLGEQRIFNDDPSLGRGPGIHVINVATPIRPLEAGFYETPGQPFGLAVSAERLFVAEIPDDENSGGLNILDITDPLNIQPVSYYNVPLNSFDLVVRGQWVYLIDYYSGLWLIDISDPANPQFVSRLGLGNRGRDVALDGVHAYVVDPGLGLQVVDISDPHNPRVVGVYDSQNFPFQVLLDSGRAYLIARGELEVLDLAVPEEPLPLAIRREPDYAVAVAAQGDNVYVVSEPQGMLLLSRTEGAFLASLGQHPMVNASNVLAVQGSYLYGAGIYLSVVDVSDGTQPVEVGRVDLGGFAEALAVAGDYAYAGVDDQGARWLRVLDVSDPTAPVEIGEAAVSGVEDLAVQDGYAYLAVGSGLAVFDVSAPTAPQAVGQVSSTAARAVDVSGDWAYVVGGERLTTLDISDPANPVAVGTYTLPEGNAIDVAVTGRVAHIAQKGGFTWDDQEIPSGLRVLDVADPSQPSEVGFVLLPNYPKQLAYDSGRVYVASYQGGLPVLEYGYAIHGRVMDVFGDPAPAVEVVSAGGGRAWPDATGQYAFWSLPPGDYTLSEDHPDYAFFPSRRQLELPPDATGQSFILLPAPLSIDLLPGVAASLIFTDTLGYSTRLDFPSGAVSLATTVTVTPTVYAGLGGWAFTGRAFELAQSAAGAAPPPTAFGEPVTVSLRYSERALAGISQEEQLALRWWDGFAWQDAGQSCDPPGTYVRDLPGNGLSVPICQTGGFGLFGPSQQVYLPFAPGP